MPETYNYTDAQIRDRVKSGKDKERARNAEKIIAQATQPPHDDDAAAMQQLEDLAGVGAEGKGFATMDAKNFVRMRLREIGGPDAEYGEKHDGGGFAGSLGKVLKTVAPIAAPFIPGIGLVGAGLLAAGGSAAGGALSGEDFNLKKTLLAGAAGAGGHYLLGGKGLAGLKGIPSKLGLSNVANAGNVTQAGTAATGGGPTSLLGKVGNFVTGGGGGGGLDLPTLAGIYDTMKTEHDANDLRDRSVEGAERDYDSKRPLREQALAGIQDLPNVQRPDMSDIYADPTAHLYRGPPPLRPGVPPVPGAPGVRTLTDRYARPSVPAPRYN